VRRLPFLLLLELSCAGPDEVSTAVSYGETAYGHETDIWNSDTWTVEARLAWDVGTRAEASRAVIGLHDELLRRERLRPEPEPAPVKTEANYAQILGALVALAAAITGWLQRENLKKGVRHISERVRRKPAEKKPLH
jgi:hypothetical protein